MVAESANAEPRIRRAGCSYTRIFDCAEVDTPIPWLFKGHLYITRSERTVSGLPYEASGLPFLKLNRQVCLLSLCFLWTRTMFPAAPEQHRLESGSGEVLRSTCWSRLLVELVIKTDSGEGSSAPELARGVFLIWELLL